MRKTFASNNSSSYSNTLSLTSDRALGFGPRGSMPNMRAAFYSLVNLGLGELPSFSPKAMLL